MKELYQKIDCQFLSFFTLIRLLAILRGGGGVAKIDQVEKSVFLLHFQDKNRKH